MSVEFTRTEQELEMLRSMPLHIKIGRSIAVIMEWVIKHGGPDNCYVSFSGGKDSSVLLYLCRSIYPTIRALFADTQLEYPEIKAFVKTWDYVETRKPKLNFEPIIDTDSVFPNVIAKYGYPFIGKEVAKTVYNARRGSFWAIRRMNGLYPDGIKFSKYNQRYVKYLPLLETDFSLSDKCCLIFKKRPLAKDKNAIVGTLTEESHRRKMAWLQTGCNAFDAHVPVSKPLSFWTEQDILSYIKIMKIPIASVYGEIREVDEKGNVCQQGYGSRLKCSGVQRSGCVYCGYGVHMDTMNGGVSRFVRLKQTHPKLYDYCMGGGQHNSQGLWVPNSKGLGMAHVIEKLNSLFSKKLKSGKIKKFIEY